jgi:uncharacterized membrane protein
MAAETEWRLLLPPRIRDLPADLAAVVGWLALTNLAVFLPVVRDTPLRIVLGIPLVLFVPGYALIAALFPEEGGQLEDGDSSDPADRDPDEVGRSETLDSADGIDGIERVALSFGVSIAVVPLVGLVLNFTPFGIRLGPIMASVSALTLACVVVAADRRRALPADERFAVPYRRWGADLRTEFLEPETRTDFALNALVVVSLLLAVGSTGYAVAVPKEGESFTEFYLLTEGDDGELVADDYPTEFARGESKPVVVGIGNQEHEPVNYTVVVELQRVNVENNSTRVLETSELGRYSPRVAHNETWRTTHDVRPTLTGDRLRLAFLLYEGDAPARPTVETAYRETHLWVNVTSA